ncbi:hypothetical protein PLICRDRAFT_40111 [Plicaturopsis crispa FD-325 SS-3]|nr:hypothetical protein PLICRDRAFT_40111 [Plicaturopsis crispa FD-325 SS-3]
MVSSGEPPVMIARHYTPDDIETAATREAYATYETPILYLAARATEENYDAICLPLTNDNWKRRWREMCILPAGEDRDDNIAAAEQRAEDWRSKPAFLLEEVNVTRLDETQRVMGVISEWLELDATDDWVRHDAEIALGQELAYASYLNITSVMLPPPRNRAHVASYARAVNACLKKTSMMELSIRLPIYDPSVFQSKPSPRDSFMDTDSPASSSSSASLRFSSASKPKLSLSESSSLKSKSPQAPEGELNATWEMWDVIRSVCDYSPRLTLTLDLTPPLPSAPGILSKWAAEPVRHIFLPSSTFIANAKGYPVLPKGTQSFIRDSMAHRPMIILSDTQSARHTGTAKTYYEYVRHLERTSPAIQAANRPGTVENYANGYQDYLQAPLQPLMDNLASVTYQTFEQDPVKYRNYEEAIYRALIDWPPNDRIIICVAGAGRGPLVARSLAAIQRSNRKAFIYAVEKNPNAYVTLQGRLQREWTGKVQLIFGDMRFIDVIEPADILVSELLGSFGDNELSPECLDGAVRFLKPDGISIPASYTAHLAPLSSSKLFNEATVGKDVKGPETPYVVMFQAVNILSGDGGGLGGRCGPQVQECWEFEHPRKDAVLNAQGLPLTNSHNARSTVLNFHIPHAGVLHGLAGYFEAVLYDGVGLSIHPHRKDQVSKDMLSWFPIFFPFKEPLYLPSNSELRVSMWRLTSQQRVWYEWYAESFLPVYNVPPLDEGLAQSPPAQLHAPFFTTPSTPVATPSPLIDAIDTPLSDFAMARKRLSSTKSMDFTPKSDVGVVKIGQTSLHNPGGRSSWIGL